jgi:hypothetical protein
MEKIKIYPFHSGATNKDLSFPFRCNKYFVLTAATLYIENYLKGSRTLPIPSFQEFLACEILITHIIYYLVPSIKYKGLP